MAQKPPSSGETLGGKQVPNESTIQKLANMTDAGMFERLATDVLRLSEAKYRSLSHPGVNASGKTVKSPLDGICFDIGSEPPHMIGVHHSICAEKDLEKKWLHDPSTVKPRKKFGKPTAPAGDLTKTAQIVSEERKRSSDLKATLILTTNREPGEKLIRDINAAASAVRIELDIWSVSRFALFLDTDPRGQYLRKQHLGIEQEQLSEELLRELSMKSLDLFKPPDRPEAWVQRALDGEFERVSGKPIVFVVAGSGLGKTVACYKQLNSNYTKGGYSLILPHEAIEDAQTIENAVERTLRQLCPSLMVGCGSIALQMSRPGSRLLLVVEDINRSGRGANLLVKINRWYQEREDTSQSVSWQLLCPVWPQVVSQLGVETREAIGGRTLTCTAFTPSEGAEAVRSRRESTGNPVTYLEAQRISENLGHDPLLIALQIADGDTEAAKAIFRYIENSLDTLSATTSFTPGEYRNALGRMAKCMLLNRQLEPSWEEVKRWSESAGDIESLREILNQREVIRLENRNGKECILLRHDRVREWLLASSALDIIHDKSIPDDIARDPYYAEIFGTALTHENARSEDVSYIAEYNPLALFCALSRFADSSSELAREIVAEVKAWLARIDNNCPGNSLLRWAALRLLAETEGPAVLELVALIDNVSWDGCRARYRNGDLSGGIDLCLIIEPGVQAVGHDALLDHVKERFGKRLLDELAEALSDSKLEDHRRRGALRLAGHIGEPALADAIRTCWQNHSKRQENLADYLWACLRCSDDNPESLLGPVCDEWMTLPEESGEIASLPFRSDLGSFELFFAIRKGLPDISIDYLIARAIDEEIRHHIVYMLHQLDHPKVVTFVATELAEIQKRIQGTNRISPFGLIAPHAWQRSGSHMSEPSKNALMGIWKNQDNEGELRKEAFRLWAASQNIQDLEVLRALPPTDLLANSILRARLQRGDQGAIPALLVKLATEESSLWWQMCRYIWSDDLMAAMDSALERHRSGEAMGKRVDVCWMFPELIMGLPTDQAEGLLIKHWDHLCHLGPYILAALYVATPTLQEQVKKVISASPDPNDLLKSLSTYYGFRIKGRPGIVRRQQLEALLPYLSLLEDEAIHDLWKACNDLQHFNFRREHLDPIIASFKRPNIFIDEASIVDALETHLSEGNSFIDYLLEDIMQAGFTIDEVMNVIRRWLSEMQTVDALRVASLAVMHKGERRHLEILQCKGIEPREHALSIITDTEFVVYRRSLR